MADEEGAVLLGCGQSFLVFLLLWLEWALSRHRPCRQLKLFHRVRLELKPSLTNLCQRSYTSRSVKLWASAILMCSTTWWWLLRRIRQCRRSHPKMEYGLQPIDDGIRNLYSFRSQSRAVVASRDICCILGWGMAHSLRFITLF
jgi:hypothetical protein